MIDLTWCRVRLTVTISALFKPKACLSYTTGSILQHFFSLSLSVHVVHLVSCLNNIIQDDVHYLERSRLISILTKMTDKSKGKRGCVTLFFFSCSRLMIKSGLKKQSISSIVHNKAWRNGSYTLLLSSQFSFNNLIQSQFSILNYRVTESTAGVSCQTRLLLFKTTHGLMSDLFSEKTNWTC